MNIKIDNLLKLIGIILVIALLICCAVFFQHHTTDIIRGINHLGWLAPVLFILVYCLATLLLLPTMVLTLAGGALFGPVIGTLLNLVGATSGAAFAFLITRHLLFDWFSKKESLRLKRLIAGVDQKGWQFIALLRLFPIIPFNLVNYGLGITGIPFRLYLMTTFVFLIPPEIIYTYCGYAGMDVLTNPDRIYKNGGLLLIIAIIFFLCLMKIMRRKKLRPTPLATNKSIDSLMNDPF